MDSSVTFAILVTVQIQGTIPFVSEVPTGTCDATTGKVKPDTPVGSAGQGTPLLNQMLLSGKWSIQSIQQLAQPGAGGTVVNLFLLVGPPQ